MWMRSILSLAIVCWSWALAADETKKDPSTDTFAEQKWRDDEGTQPAAPTDTSAPAPTSLWGDTQSSAEDSPCEGVTCANRGKCAVVHGEATCACFHGFVNDPNDELACVPEKEDYSALPKRPGEDLRRIESKHDRLIAALDGYDLQKDRLKWLDKRRQGAFDGPLEDYLEERFGKRRVAGIVLIAAGAVVGGGAAAFYVVGDGDTGYIALGSTFAVVGAISLVAGIITTAVNHTRLKRVRTYKAPPAVSALDLGSNGPSASPLCKASIGRTSLFAF
jgi:hypothetical protein